jgi:RND family efflux transporter MFP subunit
MPRAPVLHRLLRPVPIWAALALLASPLPAETPLAVEVIRAEPAPQSLDFVLTGTIEAADSFAAAFQGGGRLLSLTVQEGDLVAAGAVLATLDATQQLAARRAALAGLRGAEASLLQAQQNHDRQAALLDKGMVTRAELDAAAEALALAQAGVDQAEAALNRAETALANTTLTAPADSIVTAREAEPGQVVGAGQTVVSLAGQTLRDAVFYVPDGLPMETFLGHSVQLLSLGTGEQTEFTATLHDIAPVVDAGTGAVRVRARLDGTATPPLGEPVEGHVDVPLGPGIALPWTALTASATGPAVWSADPETFAVTLVPVTVTRFTTEAVILAADALPEGALVVGQGSERLYPGRVIRDRGGAAP